MNKDVLLMTAKELQNRNVPIKCSLHEGIIGSFEWCVRYGGTPTSDAEWCQEFCKYQGGCNEYCWQGDEERAECFLGYCLESMVNEEDIFDKYKEISESFLLVVKEFCDQLIKEESSLFFLKLLDVAIENIKSCASDYIEEWYK